MALASTPSRLDRNSTDPRRPGPRRRGAAVPTTLSLACETTPDLAATMRLQIPALAWRRTGPGAWQRTYHLHAQGTAAVRVEADRGGLRFSFRTSADGELLRDLLTATFRNGEQ